MTKKREITVITVAALLVGLLIFFDNAAAIRSARAAVFWVLKPLVFAAERVYLISRFDSFSREEVAELVRDSQRLRAIEAELDRLRSENQALKKIFKFSQNTNLEPKGAAVILHTFESGREFLLISAGKNDGIREGDLAIDKNLVLIGTVREVADASSKVVSVSSPGESVEVELIPARVHALAKGLGARALSLELVPAGILVRRGDLVVLASSQGKYPFVVGEIVREKAEGSGAFKQINAIHLARPELLKEVFVVHAGP